jgi:hypothetical protein
MASCTQCGATLVAQARFCATCGSPVRSASVRPPPNPGNADGKPTDPFARTVLKDEGEAALAQVAAHGVSPMAASVMATAQPQQPQQRAPAAPQPQARPQHAAPVATHPFVPGTLVLVYWADGNRYPGTVVQAAPQHVYVVFPNGQQHWIDVRYVTSGS